MTDWVVRLRPLALALWNHQGVLGAALGLPDETTRLLTVAGLNSIDQLLPADPSTVYAAFPLKKTVHMEYLTNALRVHGLELGTSADELLRIQEALILPLEVTANL